MKILSVVPAVPPAPTYGAYHYAWQLSRELSKRGHCVRIIAAADETMNRTRDGVEVHPMPRPHPFRAYADYLQGALDAFSVADAIVESAGKFDVAVSHGWSAAAACGTLQRVAGLAWVAVLHGIEAGRTGGRMTAEQAYVAEMERWACSRADRVVVTGRAVSGEIASQYAIEEGKIELIPPGVVPDVFEARVDEEEFRAMFAAPEERLVVCGGRLSPEKGFDVAVEAVGRLARRGLRARLVVAGEGDEGAALRERAGRFGGAVHFAGHVGPLVLSALYRVADVCVVPSRYEAYGLTILEARLHGLPVVASDCAGNVEASSDDPNVRLVPTGDADATAEAIERALAAPPARADRGPRIERLSAEHDWSRKADRFEKLFAGLSAVVGA